MTFPKYGPATECSI